MQHIKTFVNRVICGDCRHLLPIVPQNSVDFVLTDPPYLVDYHDRCGRSIAGDRDGSWLDPVFRQLFRVLKDDSFCICFYGWNSVDRFLKAWRGAGFQPLGHLVWRKPYASSTYFLAHHHEQAYLLGKGNPAVPRDPVADVLHWRYTGNTRHPTQKPVGGLLPLLRSLTQPGDIVLDPFCGSGSTLVAAEMLDCRYIGIDIDRKYCEVARRRLYKGAA